VGSAGTDRTWHARTKIKWRLARSLSEDELWMWLVRVEAIQVVCFSFCQNVGVGFYVMGKEVTTVVDLAAFASERGPR